MVDQAFRRLTDEDVIVGQQLKLSVYDESGTLLLRKGYIVASERQKQILLNKKVFISTVEEQEKSSPKLHAVRAKKEAATVTVFEWVEIHYQLLVDVYQNFEAPGFDGRKKLMILAERVVRLSEKHSDGLLAAVQLASDKTYSFIKALHVALLCDALGGRMGLNASQRLPLVAAGLTHDIGMWQLQEEIRDRSEPPSDEQWKQIRSHPARGVEMLKQAGVLDPLWLKTVAQHHERLNGSGYPLKLAGDKVSQPARILAVADTFAAMVRPRGDRDKRMPKDAMRDLFLSRGEEIDATLAQLFIKEIGLFPPGSAVQLINGEIGVVTGAGNNASSPDVEVVIDAAGRPLKRAVYRDSTQRSYAVAEMVGAIEHPGLNDLLPKMWSAVVKRGAV